MAPVRTTPRHSVETRLSEPTGSLIRWPDEGLTRVPFELYTSPYQYRAELERIYKGPVWSFLGIASDARAQGDYFVSRIGETPIIVARGADDVLRGFVNRCSHRGALLCLSPRGNVERFTCVYHAWSYELDGRLASVAFERGIKGEGGMPSSFDREQHGLRPVRLETFCGLVFGTFDPTTPPLETYLGERICSHITRVLGREAVVIGSNVQKLPSNWKLYLENVKDSYHASILHTFFTTFRLNRLTQRGEIIVDESGGNHVSYSQVDASHDNSVYDAGGLRSSRDDYGLEDPRVIDSVDEFGDGIGLQILSVFPSFVLQQVRNSIALRQILPTGPTSTDLVWTHLGFADDDEAMRARRLRQANLVGPAGYVSMEDGAVGGFVQRAIQGVDEDAGIVNMGGDNADSSPSRVTESSVRGFWKKYRSLMDP